MTKVIAFSGNSNTGKTSAIHFLHDSFIKKDPSKKIKIFHETAREYIDTHGGGEIKDVHAFECFIIEQEIHRLREIQQIKKNNTYDLVFIDRTSLDPIIYSYRNLINGNINRIDYVDNYQEVLTLSQSIYDHVVFFTTPIKIDNRFPIYNNDHINAIFEHSIRYRYSKNVIIYTNNIFFQDNLESTIFGNIFDM